MRLEAVRSLALSILVVALGCGDGGGAHDGGDRPTATPRPTATATAAATPTVTATPAPGTLDASFGSGGVVVTDFDGRDDLANAVAIQEDGGIVIAGHSDPGDGRPGFALARYAPDGTLDPSFGTGGRTLSAPPPNGFTSATKVVAMADGRLLVGGDRGFAWQVARYDASGRSDPSFGDDGSLLVEVNAFGGPLGGLAVQPDGAILVAGPATDERSRFVVVRLRDDGARDAAFGVDGIVTLALGRQAVLDALLLEPDGKIVVAGTVRDDTNTVSFALARLLPDGALDPGFGDGGSVLTAISPGAGGAVLALARTPDGGFVAAGYGAADPFSMGFAGDLAIVHYRANGTLDPSYGDAGVVRTSFGIGLGVAVTIDAGSGLFVGRSQVGSVLSPAAEITHLLSTGELDLGFAGSGVRTLHVQAGDASAIRAFAIDVDGRVLAAGYSRAPGEATDFALVRLFGGRKR